MHKIVKKLSTLLLIVFLFQSTIQSNAFASMVEQESTETRTANANNKAGDAFVPGITGAGAQYIENNNIISGNPDFQTDRFIIKYKNENGENFLQRINKKIKNTYKSGKDHRIGVITFTQKRKLKDFVNEIKEAKIDNEIEYIQPDYLVSLNTDDPLYGSQWGLQNGAASADANYESTTPAATAYVCSMGVADAWEKSTGEGAIVAVIDTGVDIYHEDLGGNIWKNAGEIEGNGLDDDNNGYIDDVNGWNFAEQTNVVYNSADAAGDTHGTHIAGIIAAMKDNGKGIAGVAPSSKIMPLKVFKNGQAYTSDIISAIEYAESMDAAIVNCSWGGNEENPALKEAIQDSDILFVCAAGNSSTDIDTTPIYPAAYDCDNIISVASVDRYGTLSSFSNYGVSDTDVAAPGEEILSTLPGNAYGLNSGTSMASAFVSGEAALLLGINSELSSTDLKTCIIDNSTKLDSLVGKIQDGNLINVINAVENVVNIAGTKEPSIGKEIKLTKAQREYLNAINSIKSFTEANAKQKKIISDYLKIDFKLLLAAEKQGYSIADSILVAKIIKNSNLKYPEIKEGLKNYTDLTAFYAASNQYSNLLKKWGYPQKILDELKQFFLNGKNMLDIERASIIAIIFDVSLNDVIAQDDEDSHQMDNYTREEAKLLYPLVNENNISIKWLAQYLKDKGMTYEEFSEKVAEFYLNHLVVRETVQAKQSDSGFTLFSSNQEEDKYKAPFSYEEYGQEKIGRNNGSLILENTDIDLPGKNGLDFKLISRYDSDEDHSELEAKINYSSVSVYDIEIETRISQNGVTVYNVEHRTNISTGEFNRINEIYKDSNTQNNVLIYRVGNTLYESYISYWQEYRRNEYNYAKALCCTPTYNQQDSPLGLGWGFVFDSIEFERNNLYKNSSGEWCKVLKKSEDNYLHLTNGETYKINADLTLEGYKLSDMKLKYDSSYNNGQRTSAFVLEYKDGIKKYFAADGRLLAIRDKYDNTIKFQHTDIHDHPVITKIIDTLGREITIHYDFTNLKVVVTTDNYSVNYNLIPSGLIVSDRESGQDKYLLYRVESRVDACFRKTTYKYDQIVSRDAFIGCSRIADNSNVLSKVIYPTGMAVEYTYNGTKRYTGMYDFIGTWLDDASKMSYYTPSRGIENYPKIIKKTILDKNGNVKNCVDYSYAGSYTGYPFDLCDDGMVWNGNVYYKTYKFIVANIQNRAGFYRGQSASKEYEFNFKHQLLAEKEYTINGDRTTNNEIVVTSYVLSNGIDYKYNTTDRQLIQKISKTYTIPSITTTDAITDSDQNLNKYVLKVEDFNYDLYGNLEKYWGPGAIRNSENQMINPVYDPYKVTYSYDTGSSGKYNLLLSKEYWKDKDTKIVQTNTLISDRKGIYESNIQQNGVIKSKTRYGYDNWGNIVNEKIFTDERTYNDEVAMNRNYIEKACSYIDNDGRVNPSGIYFNGAYLTSKSTVEVVNGSVIGEVIEEKYIYDYYGNVKRYTDPKEYETSYQYDLLGRLRIKTNLADSTTVSYDYDDTNNILSVKDENNGVIIYEYDEYGNLRYERDKITGKTLKEYNYNESFKLTSETNNTNCQNSYKIDYVYNYDGRVRSKKTSDKNENTIAQEYYLYDDAAVDIDGNGTLDSKTTKIVVGDSTSPSIVTNQYTDKQELIVREGKIFEGSELCITYDYDVVGNKTGEKSARANKESWAEPFTTKYEYDYAGRLTKTQDVNNYIATTTYDAAGRAIVKTDKLGYSALYEYDAMGRVIKESTPFEMIGSTIYYSVKKYTYDKNGNVIFEKTSCNKPGEAAAFRLTGYEYDNRNRLVKVTTYRNTVSENDNSNAVPENHTQYYYDSVGNKLRMYTGLGSPLTITGPDNATGPDAVYSTTKYAYDRFSQLISMTDLFGKAEVYAYDLNGNMISKTDRNGNTATMVYDGLSRILSSSVVTPDGSGNVSNSYTYTLAGNKLTASSGGVATTYLYDELGRLKSETEAGGIVKAYTYDADNNRKTFVITQNGVVKANTSYDYDKMNRLWKVSESSVPIATYDYDANGNRKTLIYNANGNSTSYGYNLANKLTALTNMQGATPISSYAYTYYLDGNQASQKDIANKVTNYAYDAVGRLASESTQGESAIAYSYDDGNNRKTMTVGSVVTTYDYDHDRLNSETKVNGNITEITRYTYDYNGNQIYKGLETIKPAVSGEVEIITAAVLGENVDDGGITLNEYDGFNQLKKVTTGNTVAEYTYNPDGLRISKTVNGVTTKHIWDGDQIALDLDGASAVKGKYIRGINLIAAEDGADVRKYYLFNGHGDVVQLTTSTGSVIKNYDYDAFGNEKNADANDANVFRYCGEYFDRELGTYYLRARYYDPTIGRFTTEDSVWGKASDPQSLNLYTYCGNNPIIFTDPSGHIRVAGNYTINGIYGWYNDPDASEFGKDSDIYKILVDAGNRWKDTSDLDERDKLHTLADRARDEARAGTPFRYGNDSVMSVLHQNAAIGLGVEISNYKMSNNYPQAYITSFCWLTAQHFKIGDNINWDYKWDPNWQVPYAYFTDWDAENPSFNGVGMNKVASDGSSPKNYVAWIYFNGNLMGADKLANLNWGYVGTKMGYFGAMLFNPLTTGGGDDVYIQMGVDLAKNRY